MEFNTLFTGKKFIELQSVDSTNNYAAKLLNETKVTNGTVILAHFQEKGRGQRDHQWQAKAGENITTTIIYELGPIDPSQIFRISKIAAVSIFQTLEKFGLKEIKIKWPNDIYVDSKKIAGILIENKWSGKRCTSIIGIGLNVNQKSFDQLNATSILLETHSQQAITTVLNELLSRLERNLLYLSNNKFKDLHELYMSHLLHSGEFRQMLTKEGDKLKGKIQNVLDSGHLSVLDENDDLHQFAHGDVHFIPS